MRQNSVRCHYSFSVSPEPSKGKLFVLCFGGFVDFFCGCFFAQKTKSTSAIPKSSKCPRQQPPLPRIDSNFLVAEPLALSGGQMGRRRPGQCRGGGGRMSSTSWERALCRLPPSSAGGGQRNLPEMALPGKGRARPGSPLAGPQSWALKTASQITEPGQR